MCLFKKKIKPLNNVILLQWRHEALGRLRFVGSWSGHFETKIAGIAYRGETVSGFKAIVGDSGTFIQDALIDRAKLAKHPTKYGEVLGVCKYGVYRYINAEGNAEQLI